MFGWLMAAILVGVAVHVARLPERTRPRVGEVVLVWVLAGYCGLPMVAVAVGILAAPARTAVLLGFPTEDAFQGFLGWAYLGMAVAATLALRWRGAFLRGPAITWSVFFLGASFIHIHQLQPGHFHGGVSAFGAVLLTHTLVPVLLIAGLALGGASLRRGAAGER